MTSRVFEILTEMPSSGGARNYVVDWVGWFPRRQEIPLVGRLERVEPQIVPELCGQIRPTGRTVHCGRLWYPILIFKSNYRWSAYCVSLVFHLFLPGHVSMRRYESLKVSDLIRTGGHHAVSSDFVFAFHLTAEYHHDQSGHGQTSQGIRHSTQQETAQMAVVHHCLQFRHSHQRQRSGHSGRHPLFAHPTFSTG